MAEIVNRDKTEQNIARELARLGAQQRKELEEMLGNPPDIKRVPDGWWKDKERELEAAALLLLFIPFEQSAKQHGLEAALAAEAAAKFAKSRAAELAKGFRQHSRDMLRTASRLWVPDAEITKAQMRETTLKLFGPQRMTTVAITETSFAQHYGAENAIKNNDEVATRWWRHSRFRPTGHAGAAVNPCSICTPRLDTESKYWGAYQPGIAHPACDCMSEYQDSEGNVMFYS